jgi:hypothetical protein
VDGRDHDRRQVGVDRTATLTRDPEILAEQRLCRHGPHRHEHARLHDPELRLEPRVARGDLAPARLLVDPTLAARRPLEVLDGVRHVRARTIEAGVLERAVEELPGGPHERMSLDVLAVTRLLADEHQLGVLGPFAEDRLRAGLPEWAGLAAGSRFAQLPGRWVRRNQGRRAVVAAEKGLLPHGSNVPGYGDTMRRAPGAVAEWLGRGLQSLVHQFDSGRRLSRVHATR